MAKHKVTLSIWPGQVIVVDEQELLDLTRMGLIVSEPTDPEQVKPEAPAKGTKKEKE